MSTADHILASSPKAPILPTMLPPQLQKIAGLSLNQTSPMAINTSYDLSNIASQNTSDAELNTASSSRRLSRVSNLLDKVSGIFTSSTPGRPRTDLVNLLEVQRERQLSVRSATSSGYARGSILTPSGNLAAHLTANLGLNNPNPPNNSNGSVISTNFNSHVNSLVGLAPPYMSLHSSSMNTSSLSFHVRPMAPVKETRRVFLEYDPISKRKVLNTYQIIREIGHGEHGKVKLAKDLESGAFVAIKIVNRRSKKDRPSLRRRSTLRVKNLGDDYEHKIKREIAIMKKCDHKYIVRLKEVLDNMQSYKIYLVLEYLEKGEIRWKRRKGEVPMECKGDELPCQNNDSTKDAIPHNNNNTIPHRLSVDSNSSDIDLLTDDYMPNLTFKQARRVLRNVILGLEYLHKQGIVHRDIKPANLLVSVDNDVKISDFGVSFASSLSRNDEGFLVNEVELAKTAGTPAFFAPELCTVSSPSTSSTSVMNSGLTMSQIDSDNSNNATENNLPMVDYKIDIWALGVTLYCILFGKVPFIAESEFKLFDVIVNQPVEYPVDRNNFGSPAPVSEEEFDLAKDLLNKMLDKNRKTRIDIADIKRHPFVLMDLDEDLDALNEFMYMNEDSYQQENGLEDHIVKSATSENLNVLASEIDNAVIGIGNRICRSLLAAIKKGKSINDYKYSTSASDDSSDTLMSTPMGSGVSEAGSVILSEAIGRSNSPSKFHIPTPRQLLSSPASIHSSQLHIPNTNWTENQTYIPSGLSSTVNAPQSRSSSGSAGGSKDLRAPAILLQEMIESNLPTSLSRRCSGAGTNEAPMIETKRNVIGDVYLQNQSAVDAFKGIQKQDEKIRRLSLLLPSPAVPKDKNLPRFSDSSITNNSPFNTSIPIETAPINIEKSHSEAISLPLNGSFASLDSEIDDYITEKYITGNTNTQRRRSSSTSQLGELHETKPLRQITEQLKSFNMELLMSFKKKDIKFDFNDDDDDPRPTRSKLGYPKRAAVFVNSSLSSSESDCDGPSSGCDDVADDEDDMGNLTIAFALKLKPSSRPQFLLVDNRSKSHDSRLPSLLKPSYELPIYISDQTGDADVEDVPVGLMGDVPSLTIASSITPTVSVVSSVTSSTTITPRKLGILNSPDNASSDPCNEAKTSSNSIINNEILPNKAAPESRMSNFTSDSNIPARKTSNAIVDKSRVKIASPLRNESIDVDFDALSTTGPQGISNSNMGTLRPTLSARHQSKPTFSVLTNQFKNHYRKSSVNQAYYNDDEEVPTSSTTPVTPSTSYRSNSITMGILQRSNETE